MDFMVECPVCYERHNISEMNFLWCGHGFCSDCVPNMTGCAYNCTVNSSIGMETRKIFVNPAGSGTSQHERITRLVDGLNRVEPGFPSIALKNASKKINEVIDDPTSRLSGHIAVWLLVFP
ncbi:hypothetical protein BDN72DRAFT_130039 [Pluteus cervinus]|uniref:Uncharacterized protein n=1 Tax=Pluteus cervinus TaxID=181527 RepID=A0ACD3AMR5_9AGAR|nr:hypothetical protein BDN72DRAFT_130039 [Pluteus cervinus]